MDAAAQQQEVLALTCELMRQPSVTPEDSGCQPILAQRLAPLGFSIEYLDQGGVRNLWAHRGNTGPHLVFAGHTDVVPSGPEDQWSSPPFSPTIRDDHLFGRGAADMKASLAAMIVATERWVSQGPCGEGQLSFLITSDEEGDAIYGTRYAVEQLSQRGIKPDFCVVGEPSSSQQLGDVVRCGRRGSINARLTVHGVQGHVAYPDLASNPIHLAAPALAELTRWQWDNGNRYYPPTSLQISNIAGGTGASNVIPGTLTVDFNVRFNTEQSSEGIQQQVAELLNKHALQYDINWRLSGLPFLTQDGRLTQAVSASIAQQLGIDTELSTSGGTSDGRFIAPWDNEHTVEVVELGPINATIHKVDECVAIHDLEPLSAVYQDILDRLLS